jgi:hypothetical protein
MRRPSTRWPCAIELPHALNTYPLLRLDQAAGLARLFKVFANETRFPLLHALVRGGEMCVTENRPRKGLCLTLLVTVVMQPCNSKIQGRKS